jgi:cytochrome c553
MKSLFPGLLMFGIAMTTSAIAQTALPPALIQSCEACHSKDGDSTRRDVPRLNGQQKEYILDRLREFRDPTRNSPHANQMMWQNATRISDAEAAALADYFSRKMPASASGFGSLADIGGKIFHEGDKPGIAACSVCHGLDGEGRGSTPRLAGQKEDYLINQLDAFMLTARFGSPMNHHAWDMTQEQMRAIAAYLSHD